MEYELRTEDFAYPLEDELIAQHPPADRDASRLMVLGRADGRMEHRSFRDLPALLRQGDLLVLNDTRVVPARFFCRRVTGGRVEGLFLREVQPGRWEALLRNAPRGGAGQRVSLVGCDDVAIELRENLGQGRWLLEIRPATPAEELLQRAGRTPLPPYICRKAPLGEAAAAPADLDRADRERYQTVYAARAGAVAAPTAGLHFTPKLLRRLGEAGVRTAFVTLHVGLGTFQPVTAERLSAHRMHSEWYELPVPTAEALNAARDEGRRIVAVGTTSVRVLETVAAAAGGDRPARFSAAGGWTDIFIHPPYAFRAVDALVTNFHLPRSTLLMLVAAFCAPGSREGVRTILDACAEARRLRYRFYSYGDAMLIE